MNKGMIAESIKYAAEYVAYFFYIDPFISAEEIERFTLTLANRIYKTILETDCCRKRYNQRTGINPRRECCQRSDEFVIELNVDGRLTDFIVDIAQSIMTLTPSEIAECLPDNTNIVISSHYAFYTTNHGKSVFIYKSSECMLNGNKFPLKRPPVIRFNKAAQCFDYSRKWINNNSFQKTYSYELVPRIRVVTTKEDEMLLHSSSDQTIARQKHGRKKNSHHSVMLPPKSAPPYLSGSLSFEEQIPVVIKSKKAMKFVKHFFIWLNQV